MRRLARLLLLGLRSVSKLALGWTMLLAVILVFEERFVFFPTRYPVGEWQPRDLTYEDAWFTADDGASLHGWYAPAVAPRAQVLFAHGNAGHLANHANTVRRLQRELNVAVLIFDYRGYGRSAGRPTEAGVLADARAARAWLARRAGVDERDVVLMGESIGGAVMIDLASTEPPRGLILENTFTRLADVAAHHFPWLPSSLLYRVQFDSISKIGDYHGPLLQCHGEADTVTPLALGKRLHEAANEPKQLVVIAGGDHCHARQAEWLTALERFLDGLPAERGRNETRGVATRATTTTEEEQTQRGRERAPGDDDQSKSASVLSF